MAGSPTLSERLRTFFREEWRQLITIQPSDRPWMVPASAALAIGLPLLAGAAAGRLDWGLVASLGGLVILYLPATVLWHRLIVVGGCAVAFTTCYGLGWLSQFTPALTIATLSLLTFGITILGRYFGVGPPGPLFFVMVAAIGANTPVPQEIFLPRLWLVAAGSLGAWLIALSYSVYALRRRVPRPLPERPADVANYVFVDSAVIALAVGASLAFADLLQLEKPYWVPVSCVAVLQGANLRAVWNRQVHRVVGTSLGLLLAWGFLALPLGPWSLSLILMLLTFAIETAIVRHYAFAVTFVTPLALLLAEAATQGNVPASSLLRARFVDTIVGCLVGFLGGFVLYRRVRRSSP